jgi:hypothetical protein
VEAEGTHEEAQEAVEVGAGGGGGGLIEALPVCIGNFYPVESLVEVNQ